MIQFQTANLIVFESALYRTTTTLFYNDALILLIDPNWLPIEIRTIQQTIEKIRKAQQFTILFTHSDYDHILGYDYFQPDKVIASQAFVNNPNKAKILQQIRVFEDDFYIKRPVSLTYPKVDKIVKQDNTQFNFGLVQLTCHLAQGHTDDGIMVFIESYGILIAGDYLSNIEFPFIYDNIQAYKTTLCKFEKLVQEKTVKVLITGHGDATTSQQEMLSRIALSKAYITDLEATIYRGQPFDEEKWLNRYDFPIGLKKAHQANVKKFL